MPDTLFDTLSRALRGELRRNEPLARHTTWRLGGPADLFVVPADRDDLLAAVELLRRSGTPWLILGAGSNLLVRDGGLRGAVLSTRQLRGLRPHGVHGLEAEAGVPLMTLIKEAVARGLGGLEELAGIPGTVGGGVAMNAGAGTQTVGAAVESLEMLAPQGEISRWEAARAHFAYRHAELGEALLLSARFRFAPAAPEQLEGIFNDWLVRRRQTQAVGGASAGSVFRNPAGQRAWELIDAAGLRGAAEGKAMVSEKHANFFINAGGARAADMERLIGRVQAGVEAHCGIRLEPEVRIVGEAA